MFAKHYKSAGFRYPATYPKTHRVLLAKLALKTRQ